MHDETETSAYDSTDAYVEATEPAAAPTESTTVTVEPVDYTPVIYDATSVICTVILTGALLIAGLLMGLKLWEVPDK